MIILQTKKKVMRKINIGLAGLLLGGSSLLLTSCIGSFNLTKNVLNWNNQIGSKVINELIFAAFWIVPVYEVTALADLVVLNSIEFWSGKNPVEPSVQFVETEQGKYRIEGDESGYTVTHEATGRSYKIGYDFETQTWSYEDKDNSFPLLTFVDNNRVRMSLPGGETCIVPLTEEGLTAYRQIVEENDVTLALRN